MRPHRRDAIGLLLKRIGARDLALFTTGMISREGFAAADREANFYMIGSMGLCAPVALGVALCHPQRRVVCVDGDGSALMNLGALSMVAAERPANFVHLVLDNEVYESTGSQPTIAERVSLSAIASGCGYASVAFVDDAVVLESAIATVLEARGPALLHVKTTPEGTPGVPRVEHEPEAIRDRFRRSAVDDA